MGRKSEDDFPVLETKAYHNKVILAFLAEESWRWATLRQDDPVAQAVASCLWGLVDFLHALDEGGAYLSADQAATAKRGCDVFLRCFG